MTDPVAAFHAEVETALARAEQARPVIQVNGRFLRDIAADAIAALEAANKPPRFFRRGGALVMVPTAGRAEAEDVTPTRLKGILDRVADFVTVKVKDNGERVTTPARPPADLAPDLLALPHLPFPELRTIATVPVFLPGGRLLDRDGYDAETGILVRLDDLQGVRADVPLEEAKRLILEEMLGDFPFVDEASRAHAVAALLERHVRPIITGPTPLYFPNAPTPGMGKGLLTECIALVVMGGPAPVMALSREEDEVEKRITAVLLTGAPLILLDNVTSLTSTSLAAALTAEVWRGRRLGKTEIIHVPNDATWFATGNNPDLSNELARRVIPIRLDAGVERPEQRTGFRHPNLPAWVRENRVALVSACLSIVKAWVDAGMPRGKATLGRYESWAGVIGGILEVAGIPGFLEGRDRLYQVADRETTEWEAFLAAWHGEFGDEPVTAGRLFPLVKQRGLIMDVWAGRSHAAAMQRLGHALARQRDRVFGRYVLRPAGRDAQTRNAAYRVELLGDGPHLKTPETPDTTGATSKTPSQSLFPETASAGVFDPGAAKTPAGEPKHPQNTRGEKAHHNGLSENGAGVPGVSGVLEPPRPSREVFEL